MIATLLVALTPRLAQAYHHTKNCNYHGTYNNGTNEVYYHVWDAESTSYSTDCPSSIGPLRSGHRPEYRGVAIGSSWYGQWEDEQSCPTRTLHWHCHLSYWEDVDLSDGGDCAASDCQGPAWHIEVYGTWTNTPPCPEWQTCMNARWHDMHLHCMPATATSAGDFKC